MARQSGLSALKCTCPWIILFFVEHVFPTFLQSAWVLDSPSPELSQVSPTGGGGMGWGWGLEDDFSQEPALPTPQVQVGGLYKMQGLWSLRNPVTSVGPAGILMSSEQSFPHHAHFWGVIIEAGAFLPRLGLPCLTEACLLQGYSFQPSPPPPQLGAPTPCLLPPVPRLESCRVCMQACLGQTGVPRATRPVSIRISSD